MNSRTKFVSIGLLGLLCLIQPGSLRADTVYTYKGNAYTSCTGITPATVGADCSGGPFALSITLDVVAGTPLDNLTLFGTGSDITSDVSKYSFTDGTGLNITQADGSLPFFDIGTDAYGNITSWEMGADYPAGPCVFCTQYTVLSLRSSVADVDKSVNLPYPYLVGLTTTWTSFTPGTWSPVVTAEPSTYLLLGTGLLGLLALAGRR